QVSGVQIGIRPTPNAVPSDGAVDGGGADPDQSARRGAVSDPAALLAEALADRYRIQGVVGRGGMSTVLRADDLKHDREVAIKVFRGEIAASFGTERFLREISIAAGLSHPHILPLLDSGTAAGLMYYV